MDFVNGYYLTIEQLRTLTPVAEVHKLGGALLVIGFGIGVLFGIGLTKWYYKVGDYSGMEPEESV